MQDNRRSDVSVCYLVVLNDSAEFVKIEGSHDYRLEAEESREVDQALESYFMHQLLFVPDLD